MPAVLCSVAVIKSAQEECNSYMETEKSRNLFHVPNMLCLTRHSIICTL